jgi:hypothetical protein
MANLGRVQDPDQVYVDYQGIAGYQPRVCNLLTSVSANVLLTYVT